MSNIYQSKIHKHTSYIQKMIDESEKSDNPNFINTINDLSNSVIRDIDNLKAKIKFPYNNNQYTEFIPKRNINGSSSDDKFQENGETVKDLSQNGLKRTFSDYIKVYKPAQKVRKINDNSREIEIYFSEKSEENSEIENGKTTIKDESQFNINYHLKEFERNYSKIKIERFSITSFNFQINNEYKLNEKPCLTNKLLSCDTLVFLNQNPVSFDAQKLNYSQNLLKQSNINGINQNEDPIDKLLNENFDYKNQILMHKNKIDKINLENEKLKGKLVKYAQQTEFLEKKLEKTQYSNGSDLLLVSHNQINNRCNNKINVNKQTSSKSLIKSKTSKNYEQLYYEKCEEFKNFGENFDKISEKFSDVLQKIQAYQANLIEDNRRLKEFLIFILHCFNNKQFEQISYIIAYAKENQTFIAKQIFEMPNGEVFSHNEKNFLDKAEKLNFDLDKNSTLAYSKKSSIQQEYLTSTYSFEEKEESRITSSIKSSSDNLKMDVFNSNLKYDDLKLSKAISDKIKIKNKQSEKELMDVSTIRTNKSPMPSGALNRKNNSAVSPFTKDVKNELSYIDMMKHNRQKIQNKHSPNESNISEISPSRSMKQNANWQTDLSKHLSLNLTEDFKGSLLNNANNQNIIRLNSANLEREIMNDNLNLNFDDSNIKALKSTFSYSNNNNGNINNESNFVVFNNVEEKTMKTIKNTNNDNTKSRESKMSLSKINSENSNYNRCLADISNEKSYFNINKNKDSSIFSTKKTNNPAYGKYSNTNNITFLSTNNN